MNPLSNELKDNAAKFHRVYRNPEAFDTLMILAVSCKWRGTLETDEDVTRHNLFEQYLANFGAHDVDYGWSQEQIAAQLRVIVGVDEIKQERKKGVWQKVFSRLKQK